MLAVADHEIAGAVDRLFFSDDGTIPNSWLPVLLYRGAVSDPERLDAIFASHGWTNGWRGSIYPYHHYHAATHEVLGVVAGWATVKLGGERGSLVDLIAGDVVVIPAGVGHRLLAGSDDFEVVGAYPNGADIDMLTGRRGERPAADARIAAVPRPDQDPLFGAGGPLESMWRARGERRPRPGAASEMHAGA